MILVVKMSSSNKVSSVFYAETYHPIQAGSIDGTDTLPHDHAIYRALLCSNNALYDPFGDPKVIGDPCCTLFNLRLVRHIVTGASRGYDFVEFETEKEMFRAYKDAHHTYIDDSEIIVDYNRQHLMPVWILRRLGGGLSDKKESGQLRFGGREKPFRAPLRPIPWDELKRLGIPTPPEGRYMSCYQIPSPPRRKRRSADTGEAREREKRSKYSHSFGGDRSMYNEDRIQKTHKENGRHSYRHEKRGSSSKVLSEERAYINMDRDERSSRDLHRHDRWSPSGDDLYRD
ncbi:hypothetical protein ACJIZ3_004419 [Penstemon smallii]|uniref:RRM domain-containing protein n=1 Tax=Penstemon smallii TaxID=265156 RepID=A0ABD3S1Y8_9LAMI